MARSCGWRRTLLLIGAFSAGCAAPVAEDNGVVTDGSDSSLIIGDLDWVEVTTLAPSSTERQRSRAIGNVEIPARSARCTGFLIARDTLLTNAHCVPNEAATEGLTVAFSREHGVPASQWSVYTCDEYLGSDRSLDYALLRCRGNPGDAHGVLELTDEAVDVDDDIYVVHQNCDFHTTPGCAPDKKLSPGKVSRVGQYIRYNADTALGSSGAPALLRAGSHRVIGVHHAGYGDDGTGRGSYTESIAMTSILPSIRRQFPSVRLGHLAADAHEPNTASTPTLVSGNFTATDLTIHDREDRDFFRVDLPAGGTIDVAIRFTHADGDLELRVADRNADSSTNDESLVTSGLAPGRYDVEVFGYRGAMNRYSIEIRTAGPDDTIQYEPNEDGVSAARVPVPFDFDGRIATAADVDVFRIEHDGAERSMRLAFSHAAGDLDLYVYDGRGEAIGGSTSVEDEEIVRGTFAAGTMYVQVVGYDGALGDYRLDLD